MVVDKLESFVEVLERTRRVFIDARVEFDTNHHEQIFHEIHIIKPGIMGK